MIFPSHLKKITSFILFVAVSISLLQSQHKSIKLDEAINTSADELAPYITQDGKTLFFVRTFYDGNIGGEESGQDIWYSMRNADSTWSKAKNIGAPVNNKLNNSICGVSSNGETIFLTNIYVNDKKMQPGLSYSTLESGKWNIPKSLNFENENIKKGFFGFHLSEDEKYLILSIHDENSLGEEDLYISEKNTNGKWSKPISLGPVINTTEFESSPFLSLDHKSLYFCSNGHEGYGNGDLFVSHRLDDTWTNWSAPKNLGPNINTKGLDSYLSISKNGEAYFVSGDNENDLGDIYTFKAFDIQQIMDSSKTISSVSEPVISEVTSDTIVHDLYFDFNSHELSLRSKMTLSDIIKLLEADPNYSINVTGFTDIIGSVHYNLHLSEKRASQVKNYLLEKNIKSPIVSKGQGIFDPKSIDKSDEFRKQHRKVIVVLHKNKK